MFWLHLTARLMLAAFALMTWAYAVACFSPFAFDMFIQPRLLPSVSSFVAWHHLWYWAVYLPCAVSLAAELRPAGRTRSLIGARWLAVAFVLVFGIIGVRLVSEPFLPQLGHDGRSLSAALCAVVPLIWMALIDHLIAWPAFRTVADSGATPPRRLLIACAATAAFVWLIHMAGLRLAAGGFGAVTQIVGGLWALALCATTFMLVYILLTMASGVAAITGSPRAWEYGLVAGLVAVGIGELIRRVVLRAISFDGFAAIPVSGLTGVALAAQWSGLALRRAYTAADGSRTGLELLIAPGPRRAAVTAAVLLLLPLVLHATLVRIDRLDWNFVIQKLVVVSGWTMAFSLFVRVCMTWPERPSSIRGLVAPPVAALVALHGIPLAAASSGAEGAAIAASLDRYTTRDLALRLQAGAFVRQPGLDPEYNRYLQLTSASSINGSTSLPRVEFSASPPPSGTKPHIFLFVIDSLRRDYVSLYNEKVEFTPELERFGRDSFVFANAFTQYGGTWLSMPALWVGGPAARGWGGAPFERVNAIEQLVVKDGYRLAINDFTVSGYLLKSTPRTFLQPDVPSVDTDLCALLPELEAHLDRADADPRPVLAYLAPMNVHLLNTRSGSVLTPGERYPGFYEPYASRLRRLDACFGRFVEYLKGRAIYEHSVIVITSDHGDSLGENGQWGHQFGLFPEHIRVPLIVRIPDALRSTVTTDLSRVSFLTDLAPTLYALLGHTLQSPGPLFGSPLFVPRDSYPAPRRRDSFLLMSSYGPTYGLLRRNGRFLYVSDIAEGRDFAFDLSTSPLGTSVEVTPDLRQVNQRLIRQLAEDVNEFYGIRPTR